MASPNPKTVLITGCSAGGIGDALARSFQKRGLTIFATARSLSKIAHLKELGMAVMELDITVPASIENAVNAVKEITGGKLDILVNNSGVGYSTPILDADLGIARNVFETNFFGRVAVTQAFMPLLLASKGTVLNIGSIAGYSPSPWQSMYGASCAAVHQWNDVLRIELQPFGVSVVLVITGAVNTNFINNLPTTTLSPTSLYNPGRQAIEAAMNTKALRKNFVPVDAYADEVVNNVLKKNPRKRQWAGGVAVAIWTASTFLWATAWDWLLAEDFGVNALRKGLKVEGKDK